MKTGLFRKFLFEFSYLMVGKTSVIKYYKEFMKSQWWPYDKLVEFQSEQLQRLIHFVYEYVPYYRKLFNSLGIEPYDIKSPKDLQKIPILTKQIIRQHWDEMIPTNLKTIKYVYNSTGGSTGEPLKYLMSIEDLTRGIALLYRGWSYGGYQFGNKMVQIAGSSLIPTTQSSLQKWVISILRNIKSYSSYGISDETLMQYLYSLNKFKPQFLRGYASSIYLLASFIRDKGLSVKFRPQAIFTTSEKLLENQRKVIEEVFSTEVFDNYGLNDGGVSAYECEEHCGMHIDMERAILEVVDENGQQVIDKPGKILATSLYNYAFPFIRYDTGDIGIIVHSKCLCGRQSPLLKEVIGRITDVLDMKGRKIGSPVLTVLFGKFDIEQYQIVQCSDDTLICKIVKGPMYTNKDEEFIRRSLISHLGEINITFEYVTAIESHQGLKHKFIIDARNSFGNINKEASHRESKRG